MYAAWQRFSERSVHQQLSIEKLLPRGIPAETITVDDEDLLVRRDYVIDYV